MHLLVNYTFSDKNDYLSYDLFGEKLKMLDDSKLQYMSEWIFSKMLCNKGVFFFFLFTEYKKGVKL